MPRDTVLELFLLVCQKPNLYVQCSRFTAVSAFIAGYDEALHGGALVGFREWLLIGNKDWTNLPWWSLIRLRLNPKADLALPPSEDEETPLLGTLRSALEDFSKVYKAGGIPKVFHDYNTWLLSLSDATSPTPWFGRNGKGEIYRYSLGGDGTAHFRGIHGVGDGTRNITRYALDRLNGL